MQNWNRALQGKNRIRAAAALAIAAAGGAFLISPVAKAASQTWTGGSGVDGNWSTAANWGGNPAPGATSGTASTDVATFNAAIANGWGTTATPVVIDSATQNIGGLSFDLAAGNFTIGTIGANSLLTSSAASGSTIQILSTLISTNAIETINASLVLNGGLALTNNSANGAIAGAGTLNIGGNISNAGAAKTLTLSGSNTNANTVSGVISGATNLAKSGAGLWMLSGNNTYSGTTVVSGGTLQFAGTNTGAGAITINSTGTILLSGANGATNAAYTINAGGTLTLNNVGANRINRIGAKTVTMNGGALNLIGGSADSTELTSTFAIASLANTVNLTAGSGSVVFTNSAVTRTAGATLLVTGDNLGATPGAGNTNLVFGTHSGTPTAAVGGVGTAGSTSIAIEVFAVGRDTAKVGNAQYGLVTDIGQIGGNGVRILDLATEYTTSIADGATALDNASITSGVTGLNSSGTTINALRLDNGSVAGSGTLTLNAGTILAVNATNAITVNTLAFGTREAIIFTVGNLSIGSTITGTVGGITKSGTGVLTVSGTNNNTGPINVSEGTLKLSGSANLFGGSANLKINSADAVFDLAGVNQTATGAVNNAGTITNTGAAATLTLANASSTNTGVITGNLNLELANASGSAMTIAGSISNSGTITNSGSGTHTNVISGTISGSSSVVQDSTTSSLNLTGANTNSGGTIINAGTVTGSTSSAFGTGTIYLGATSGSADATLRVNNSNVNLANTIVVRSGSSGNLTLLETLQSNVGTGVTSTIILGNNLTIASNGTGGAGNPNFQINGSVLGKGNLTIANSATVNVTGILLGGAGTLSTLNFNGSLINNSVASAPTLVNSILGAKLTSIVENTSTNDLSLRAVNNAFAGSVVVNLGKVILASDKSLNNVSATVSISSVGTLDVTAGSAGQRRTFAGISGTAGSIVTTLSASRNTTLALAGVDNFTYAGALTLTAGGGITILKSGVGTQTFTGSIATASPVTSAGGGTIKLSGPSGVLGATSGLVLQNGALVLDNSGSGNNNNNRVNDTATVGMENGSLTVIGNATSATSETMGALTVNSGGSTITLDTSGNSNGADLTFASLTRANWAQINFVGLNGTLGTAGANPRILFTTNPSLTNDVIANSAASAILGYATVNGTDFAGYNATTGVVAVTSTGVSGPLSTAGTQNSVLTASGSIAGSTVTYNTLKILPSAAGQTLDLTGAGNLNTNGILLAGTNDFTIQNTGGGTGGISGGAAQRVFYVNDPSTTLNVGVTLTGAAQDVIKAGAGFMALTGSTNQLAFTTPAKNISIAGGTLRGTLTNLGGGTAAGGAFTTILFRGGVLEISGGGSLFRAIDLAGTTLGGGISWEGTAITDAGSGGFSAIGGNADVTLVTTVGGATAASLVWNDGKFVSENNALIMGSTKATDRIELKNAIGLDAGTAGNAASREIRVLDNTAVTTDVALLSGIISGSATSDLVKTGAGTLQLSNVANTYQGKTHVVAGTLQVLTGSSLGTGNIEVSNSAILELDGGAGTIDEISNAATLTLDTGGKIFLNFTGTESVDRLVLGGQVFDYPITFSGAYTQAGGGFTAFFAAGSTGSLQVVPEPTSLSLIGLGAGGLLARRRRYRSAGKVTR